MNPADVDIGTSVPEWRLARVTDARMRLLAAILRDPNPIHWDRDEVAARGLGDRLINQGPTNVGYVCNALLAWAGNRRIALAHGALHLERVRRRRSHRRWHRDRHRRHRRRAPSDV